MSRLKYRKKTGPTEAAFPKDEDSKQPWLTRKWYPGPKHSTTMLACGCTVAGRLEYEELLVAEEEHACFKFGYYP